MLHNIRIHFGSSFSDNVYASPPRYRYTSWTMALDNFQPVRLAWHTLDRMARNLQMSRDGQCNQLPCCSRAFNVVWRRQLRRVLHKYIDKIHDNLEERNQGMHLQISGGIRICTMDTIGKHLLDCVRDLLGMGIDDWQTPEEQEEAEDHLWPDAASCPSESSHAKDAKSNVAKSNMIRLRFLKVWHF